MMVVARRLQDSAADVVALSFDRAEKAATAGTGCNKTCNVGFGADDYDACAWCRSAIVPAKSVICLKAGGISPKSQVRKCEGFRMQCEGFRMPAP
jgi:hypothetical protein